LRPASRFAVCGRRDAGPRTVRFGHTAVDGGINMTNRSTATARKPECLSMTGYAQSRGEVNGWAVRVSVKSVNHRFLDLKLRLPEGFDLYELRLRQVVRDRIHRGHVDVHVGVEPGASTAMQVNRDLVQAYLKAADDLRLQTSVTAGLDVVALLRLP